MAVALVLAGGAACTNRPTAGHPAFAVDAAVALADQPVSIRITDLAPRERVELTARAVDFLGAPWQARAVLEADERGVVDLARQAPAEGSYAGVDAMGLFWSMDPVAGSTDQGGFAPPFPERQAAYPVTLTATGADGVPVTQELSRQWTSAGVTHRTLDLARDGVAGDLYLPAPETTGRPGVLLIGGSGGGAGPKFQAALLASRGHPALAVSYFAVPGRPETLRNIAVEYFAAAAGLLPGPVHVLGYSRGSEAALLLGALYPDTVRSVVVFAPADRVWPAYPPPGNAWTHGGLPQLDLPFDRLRAPVLAIAGDDDRLWPAGSSARTIERRTGGTTLIYPLAGHGVANLPYLASMTEATHPVSGAVLDFGGTRPADAAARHESWAGVLDFLAAH